MLDRALCHTIRSGILNLAMRKIQPDRYHFQVADGRQSHIGGISKAPIVITITNSTTPPCRPSSAVQCRAAGKMVGTFPPTLAQPQQP